MKFTDILFLFSFLHRPGHYNRALEEAISSHKNQWPRAWEDQSPLSGGSTFATMNPTERVSHATAATHKKYRLKCNKGEMNCSQLNARC